MKLTDSTANLLATTSFVSWLSAISTLWNPIISMIGGLIAIITGLVGLIYYLKKLRNEGN
jgi:flagellar biogenesis protein FliO